MRTYDQLNENERRLAWEECHLTIADIIFNGIVCFQDEVLSELIAQTIEESEGDFALFYSSSALDEAPLCTIIEDMAEAMAMNAEYPSMNEDGSYKKVIQL